MREIRFDDFNALRGLAEEGWSDWGVELTVTQEMIDRFADLTGDAQWIHVDIERARREGPFGGPIAHGFLTLSLTPSLRGKSGWRIVGHRSGINYGAKGLRFLAPVPAGGTIHARLRLVSAEAHAKGTLVTSESAVHVVGQEKPSLLYQGQALYQP